jgi:hypothetical protein
MFDTLQALHFTHNVTVTEVPALGFVAYDSATPIAAGFLRMVEGGYAQIDTLVSSASLSSEMRHEGVSKVVDALIQAARDLGLKGVYAHTSDEGVVKRAAALGFKHVPQMIIALPL